MNRHPCSRRAWLCGLAASAVAGGAASAPRAAGLLLPDTARGSGLATDASAGGSPGPVFFHGGPDAARYGEADGYPVPPRKQAIAQGNPWSPGERVGAFSHLDQI